MVKKVLIVEDTQEYKVKFRNWATAAGFEVIEATTVQEGVEKATYQRPDVIITDFGLPNGNGNDLARRVREVYSVPIAGITAGDPKSFDRRVVDIPETKSITEKNFRNLLSCLSGETPRDRYVAYGTEAEQKQKSMELPNATSLFFQAYYIIKAERDGLREIVVDSKTIISQEQWTSMHSVLRKDLDQVDPQRAFEFFQTGEFNAQEVYESACANDSRLKQDKRFAVVLTRLGKGDYAFSLDDAVYVAEKLGNIGGE